MYELTVCKADGAVIRRFDLSHLLRAGRPVRVGRGDDCEIRITNGTVSRHHCEIEAVEEDEWVIRDLGSTHGTRVGGEPIAEVEIEEGLEVRVGPAVLRFESVAARIGRDLAREIGEPEDAED